MEGELGTGSRCRGGVIVNGRGRRRRLEGESRREGESRLLSVEGGGEGGESRESLATAEMGTVVALKLSGGGRGVGIGDGLLLGGCG